MSRNVRASGPVTLASGALEIGLLLLLLLGHRRGDDLKIHSDISPAPHLNFTWVETSKFWLDF